MIVVDALVEEGHEKRLGLSPFYPISLFNFWQYYTNSGPYNGPLGDVAIGTGAFIHTPYDSKDKFKRPQIQLLTLPFYMFFDWSSLYSSILGFSDNIQKLSQEYFGRDGMAFLPGLLRQIS